MEKKETTKAPRQSPDFRVVEPLNQNDPYHAVLILPGPVGLQLERDLRFGSRVVRFVDGGPQNPGAARATQRIHPGDWIVQVTVHNEVATSYPEIMRLLQKAHLTRKLIIRSFALHVQTLSDLAPIKASKSTESTLLEDSDNGSRSQEQQSGTEKGQLTQGQSPIDKEASMVVGKSNGLIQEQQESNFEVKDGSDQEGEANNALLAPEDTLHTSKGSQPSNSQHGWLRYGLTLEQASGHMAMKDFTGIIPLYSRMTSTVRKTSQVGPLFPPSSESDQGVSLLDPISVRLSFLSLPPSQARIDEETREEIQEEINTDVFVPISEGDPATTQVLGGNQQATPCTEKANEQDQKSSAPEIPPTNLAMTEEQVDEAETQAQPIDEISGVLPRQLFPENNSTVPLMQSEEAKLQSSKLQSSKTSSNKLLEKAMSKQQLSLARLRARHIEKKLSLKSKEQDTVEGKEETSGQEMETSGIKTKSDEKDTNDGKKPTADDDPSQTNFESTGGATMKALTVLPSSRPPSKPQDIAYIDGDSPKTVDTTRDKGVSELVPQKLTLRSNAVDFSQFSKEQVVIFEAGPVGMQLEQLKNSPNSYTSRIVRFVDGGPQHPGQARLSGILQPGDYVVRVEAEGIVGTTYFTILHLLQKTWASRKLTFRSAWDSSTFLTPEKSGVPSLVAQVQSVPTKNSSVEVKLRTPPRSTSGQPRKENRHVSTNQPSPLPYDWSPLPYDWIHRAHPKALTKGEQKARHEAYEKEAEALIRSHEERLEREKIAKRTLLARRGSNQWDFEDVLIGALAATAESVSGCLRKQRHHDNDSDEEYFETPGMDATDHKKQQ